MRLEGIQSGDIIEVDRLGRRFHAIVTGNAPSGLAFEPLDPGLPTDTAEHTTSSGTGPNADGHERPRNRPSHRRFSSNSTQRSATEQTTQDQDSYDHSHARVRADRAPGGPPGTRLRRSREKRRGTSSAKLKTMAVIAFAEMFGISGRREELTRLLEGFERWAAGEPGCTRYAF